MLIQNKNPVNDLTLLVILRDKKHVINKGAESLCAFRLSKDILLFNIKSIPLHLFNFIFILLQRMSLYTLLYIQI